MQSKAKTVKAYLAELPEDRRKAISKVRAVIRKHLPKGYKETMQYGMISYVVPLSTYPAGYLDDKKTPLPYASLASQKNHMAVYLMSIYGAGEKKFKEAYKKTGKRMDIGKSCVRFRKLEDLPLELVGKEIASMPVKKMIAKYEAARKK